jgi:hypothetical protein
VATCVSVSEEPKAMSRLMRNRRERAGAATEMKVPAEAGNP